MSKDIRTILALLRTLQGIDPEFPLQYAICLNEIALDEGLSLTTLAERCGMPLSTVSRVVGALSCHRQRGNPYELVKVAISATERRKKEISLTPRGRAVIDTLVDILADKPTQRLRA